MKIIFVYITIETKTQAKTLVKTLIEKKLIACANIFPIESMYVWKEKLEEICEYVIIAKTKLDNWELLKQTINEIHPYEIPCITKINVEPNCDFKNWLLSQII